MLPVVFLCLHGWPQKRAMLRAQGLSQWYGAQPILRDVSFTLSRGERLGLVGANAAGKSTLLRLLAGQEPPDGGNVWLDPHASIAYLPQYPSDDLPLAARESLLRGLGPVGELQRRLAELEGELARASGERLDATLAEYAGVRERFERLGGYEIDARLEEVTRGLGLHADLEAPVAALSGGAKTKLSLARLLLSRADVLLLDEPTTYLDLPALLWLERFVRGSTGSFIIVSHDRRFLDRTVSGILELDTAGHTVRLWPGTYRDYAAARQTEERKQWEAYRDQQAEVRRLEEDIRRTKEQARGVERSINNDVLRRSAKKVAAKAKARERRLERQLTESTIEKPRQSWGLHLVDLGREPIADNRTVLEVTELHAGYGDHMVLRDVSLLIRGHDRVALLGENGSGKSTLLRAVAGTIPYRGTIRLGPSIRPGWLSQEGEELAWEQTVLDTFRARTEMREDEARTYLHKFLFAGDEVRKPVAQLSYGQRAKLALAVLVLSGANFLVLDEPTSHLDIPALEAMEETLAAYHGPFLVVSHDRAFLHRIGINRVLVVAEGTVRELESVEEYERQVA